MTSTEKYIQGSKIYFHGRSLAFETVTSLIQSKENKNWGYQDSHGGNEVRLGQGCHDETKVLTESIGYIMDACSDHDIFVNL